jgi:hypothetical protein
MSETVLEDQIYDFLIKRRGYLKSLRRVSKKFNAPMEIVRRSAKRARKQISKDPTNYAPQGMKVKSAWQGGLGGEMRYSYEKEKVIYCRSEGAEESRVLESLTEECHASQTQT